MSDPPRCAACGAPVGVYELLHWRRPDGTFVSCGWLEAREDDDHAHPLSAFFHSRCRPEQASWAEKKTPRRRRSP